jgi:hypothetical protein
MRVEIINQEFPDLNKFVLYQGENAAKSLVKARSSELTDPDFIETDFRYHQGKTEFGSPDILNELVQSDKDKIGESIEKYLSTLFPTLIEDSSPLLIDTIEYYSSVTKVGGDELFCLLIPEDIDSIIAYDSHQKEAIRIEFQGDEVRDSKALWFVISYKPESPRVVNLSYEAYQGDRNPVRKMSEYVLRNDSLVLNWEGYEERDGFLYSKLSGSLVGTSRMTARPIYNMMCGLIGEEWNRAKRYSVGDTAKVGDTVFKSVEANNIGNHPYYSRMWIKSYDN